MKKSLFVLLIGAAGLLAACGGASNDTFEEPAAPAAPSGAVPASATSSIEAFISFLAGLMLSETAVPLTVDGVVPPTSETAAPLPVN